MNANASPQQNQFVARLVRRLGQSKLAVLFAACALSASLEQASAQTNVYVDPALGWQGYMNVFDLGNNYQFGTGWGTADLAASFSGAVLTLAPNHIGDPNPYWYTPSGQAGATGNKIMDANYYVQDDSLAGQTVTFSGYCWGNTLVATNNHCTAFIKDFASDFSSSTAATTNLLAAGFFSITLTTAPGDHVQFGFETVGPCWWVTDVDSKGSVLVSSNPPPAGPAITSLPATPYVNVTSNVTITVAATGSGLTYQWKKNGVNLVNGSGVSGVTTTSLTLSNVTGAAEANYSVVVKDSLNQTVTGNAYLIVFTPNNLSFDTHATLNGYINAFNYDGTSTPGGYATGFSYPTAPLRASVADGVATLQPNVSLFNNSDAFWSDLAGGPNKWVEADYFIANDDLAGQTLTFNGYCPSNSVDASFTPSAWMTAFAPDFSSSTTVVSNLVAGQSFSISLAAEAGTHIQYGLRMFGLDYPASNPLSAGVTLVTLAPPTLSASRTGNVTTLNFLSVSGHSYTVQYKNNLTDSVWQNLSTTNGTGATVSTTDSTGVANRFYRLAIQ